MFLAIPMKIKKIKGNFAFVETGRLTRKINIAMLPSARIGDYVIVHAGFAIQRLDSRAAEETLGALNEIY